jgi:hypothetical protein
MGCGKKKYVRIRTKKIGKKGDTIKVGVRRTKGPRGGRTERIGKVHHAHKPRR